MIPSQILAWIPVAAVLGVGLGSSLPGAMAQETREIQVERQWRGSDSDVETRRVVVYRTREDWARAWEQAYKYDEPKPPLPPVDFETSMVVAIYAGTQRSGGTTLSVQRATMTGDRLKVHIASRHPPEYAATQVISHPFCFAVVPRASEVGYVFE